MPCQVDVVEAEAEVEGVDAAGDEALVEEGTETEATPPQIPIPSMRIEVDPLSDEGITIDES